MVWVSNCGFGNILVTITNQGDDEVPKYTIRPQSWQNPETSTTNYYERDGPENLTIEREGGKTQSLLVGPSDFVRVYIDVVIVTQATVFLARGEGEHELGSNDSVFTVGDTSHRILRA